MLKRHGYSIGDDGKIAIVFATAFFLIVLLLVGCMPNQPRDNSDPIGGRSNMNVLTDALTGCQYLETRKGGITPRMDANNKQVCN